MYYFKYNWCSFWIRRKNNILFKSLFSMTQWHYVKISACWNLEGVSHVVVDPSWGRLVNILSLPEDESKCFIDQLLQNKLFSPTGHGRLWSSNRQVFGVVGVPLQQDQRQRRLRDGLSRESTFWFSLQLSSAAAQAGRMIQHQALLLLLPPCH